MSRPEKLLVVEDREGLRAVLCKTLESAGFEIEAAADGDRALEALRVHRFAMVLTDLRLPGANGHAVLNAARQADPDMPVILMTAYGTIPDAVGAMREGAYDYLEKPVDHDHLLVVIRRALEHRRLQRENHLLRARFAKELEFPEILGESRALNEALEQVRRVAGTDTTVLLGGETGSGKELFARALHHLSGRKKHSFLAINCAAIPDSLLESELFGYEKGAFTGAAAGKRGKIEIADQGTMFLDEIGDLSPVLQGKVLRVVERRQFERVGGMRTHTVDVRLVAATNKDLARLVAEGSFRKDLFFRLSVFPIVVPPLRDRREDIPILARHFAAHFAAEHKRRAPVDIAPETLELMVAYAWPGNVRELQNAIERALILGEGSLILPRDLHLPGLAGARTRPPAA